LIPDSSDLPEISIPARKTGVALHGDHVLVKPDRRRFETNPAARSAITGTVTRILERRRTQFAGSLKRSRGRLSVVLDDPRIPHEISVPDCGSRPARPGEKVVVTLREWNSPSTSPQGVITEVLGRPDSPGVDMLAILRQHDLPQEFPTEVLREAREVGTEISLADLDGRVDCRSHPVITIDPKDAKDFDDAFSLQPCGAKRWRLQIHIADVSHYVKPGSSLDNEARRRGNSTYLVDRVIPMIPEELSNELCSLKPHVDRLSKCVEFLLTDDGSILKTRFHSAVIRSHRRFTYEQAMTVLKRTNCDPLEQMLRNADRLAQNIRQRRFRNGSLNLEFPEISIQLDGRGRVTGTERVEYDQSHQLIEEFMLLVNEAVAARLRKIKRPSLHRVHERPDPERLQAYREEVLSHNVPCGNLEKPSEVRKLLDRLDHLPIGSALKIGFLKSLTRARYAAEPLGHYGLAKTQYAHFTSPIRRYTDLVVHRSLFEASLPDTHLQDIATHTSAAERNSADAERNSKTVKLHAFLKAQLSSGRPKHYSALVTDIREFGFFVEVRDLGLTGLVPFSKRGGAQKRTTSLGADLTVEVCKVDCSKQRVDFRLVTGTRKGRDKARNPGQGTRSRTTNAERASGSTQDHDPRRQDHSSKQIRRRPARRRRRSRPQAVSNS
jgi:ribonuclease R